MRPYKVLPCVFSLMLAAAAQSQKLSTQGSPISPVTHTKVSSVSPKAHPVPTDFEQDAVYWTDEPGWHSELQLKNNLDGQDLTVTPALRMANGTELVLAPVTIKPADVVSVDLHDAAVMVDPNHVSGYGSIVLRFRATVFRALYAAVMVHDTGHPIAFHMDAFPAYTAANMFVAGSHEGIWWLPNSNVTDYLILTNTHNQPVDNQVVIYDATGVPAKFPITLDARETRRLSVRTMLQNAGLTGSYGGIEVDTAQGAGYIDIVHFVFDEVSGFGAIMKTFEHHPDSKFEERSWGGVKQWTIRAPMLALTTPDPALSLPPETQLEPKVFVRNASAKTYTADIRFNWYSGSSSGKSALMPIPLRPHETKLIDVSALQSQNTIPSNAWWSSVIISAPIQPEELMAVAASYDKALRYGTQTPFNDQLAAHWEGGKWEVDGTHDSIVTAGNGGNKPIQAQVTLFYNGGQSKYQVEQTLDPDQQLWLDLGRIIHNQVPDKNGNILPASLTSGTYQFRDLTDPAVGDIFEGKVITDKTYGHAAYGCMQCCNYPDGGFMWTDPLGVPVSSYSPQDIGGVNSCTGDTDPISRYYRTWWTGDTSIATAAYRQVSGVAYGSTSDLASGTLSMGQLPKSCPTHTDQPQGGVTAFQVILQGNPFLIVGNDPQLSYANRQTASDGNGNPPKPTGGTFSLSSDSDPNDTSTTGTISGLPWVSVHTLDQSTSPGDRTLSFVYTLPSGAAQFKLFAMTAREFAYATNSSLSNACTGVGFDYTIVYTPYTHPDKTAVPLESNLLNTVVTESFNPANSCANIGPGAIQNDSTFSDRIAGCSNDPNNPPPPCSLTTTQTLQIEGYTVRTNTLTYSGNTLTYTPGGPNQ